MERGVRIAVASAIGLANGFARWLQFLTLGSILLALNFGFTTEAIASDTSKICINHLSDEEILNLHIFSNVEAQSIILHRKQFGNILDLAELIQCDFSVDRLLELQNIIDIKPDQQLKNEQWRNEIQKGSWGFLTASQYNSKIKLDTNILGTPLGISAQWRYSNSKYISVGICIQIDPGEKLPHPDFKSWHLRISQYRWIDQCVVGRFTVQLGQGLVQGGQSGFWNAPIQWARKTTDWQLSEKRGFDEYRGYNGMAIATKPNTKGFQWMWGASQNAISGRLNENQRITSLITDGKFTTANQLKYKDNLTMNHEFIAMQWLSNIKNESKRKSNSNIGMGLSLYQFSKPWEGKTQWPVNNAKQGSRFGYPELWFTRYGNNGGMAFGHLAIQGQQQNSTLPKTTGIAGFKNFEYLTQYPTAWVLGYAIPTGRKGDISIRYYKVAPEFRSPQGLYNQLRYNYQMVTFTAAGIAMIPSAGTKKKIEWRWSVDMGKTLSVGSDGRRRFIYKQQIYCKASLGHVAVTELLAQLRNRNNPIPWDDISLASGTSNPTLTSSGIGMTGWGGLADLGPKTNNDVRGQPIYNLRKKGIYNPIKNMLTRINFGFTESPKALRALGHTFKNYFSFEQKIGLIPSNTLGYSSSFLALAVRYRKPFSPLKISAEFLNFQTTATLYYSMAKTPNEIGNLTISGSGQFYNLMLEYTIKSKNHNKIHLALRGEILRKTQNDFLNKTVVGNPLQPRIFVAIWCR